MMVGRKTCAKAQIVRKMKNAKVINARQKIRRSVTNFAPMKVTGD